MGSASLRMPALRISATESSTTYLWCITVYLVRIGAVGIFGLGLDSEFFDAEGENEVLTEDAFAGKKLLHLLISWKRMTPGK